MDKNNQNKSTAKDGSRFGKNRKLYISGVAKELPSGVVGLPENAVLDNYDPPVCIGFSDSISTCTWNSRKYHLGFYVTGKSQDRPDKGFPSIVKIRMLVYGSKVCFRKAGDIADCIVEYSTDSGKIINCSFTGKTDVECQKQEIEDFIRHIIHLFGEINCMKKQEILEKAVMKNPFVAKQTKKNQKLLDGCNDGKAKETETTKDTGNSPAPATGKSFKQVSAAKPEYKTKYWIRQNLYRKDLEYKESCICSRHCLISDSRKR